MYRVKCLIVTMFSRWFLPKAPESTDQDWEDFSARSW